MAAARPLAGLKVLELGALIAGPFCTKILAEFGAEVVKIEPPGQGDPLRKWRYLQGRHVGVVARAVAQQALGRRRPARSPRARRSRARSRERADIVVENFRPGTLEGWGLGYDALAPRNPGPRHGAHLRLRPDRARTASARASA